MKGRITFAGNPWPKGHPLETLDLAGRVDPDQGLFLDVHLVTTDYASESNPKTDDDTLPDWKHPSVWNNYHRCSISSLKWPGEAQGLLVATAKRPLESKALTGKARLGDLATHSDTRALHVYLLGHDSVRSVDLRLSRTGSTYALAWTGKLALTYAGDTVFRHRFSATATGVAFEGFVMPTGSTAAQAAECRARFARPGALAVKKRGRGFVLTPSHR